MAAGSSSTRTTPGATDVRRIVTAEPFWVVALRSTPSGRRECTVARTTGSSSSLCGSGGIVDGNPYSATSGLCSGATRGTLIPAGARARAGDAVRHQRQHDDDSVEKLREVAGQAGRDDTGFDGADRQGAHDAPGYRADSAPRRCAADEHRRQDAKQVPVTDSRKKVVVYQDQ